MSRRTIECPQNNLCSLPIRNVCESCKQNENVDERRHHLNGSHKLDTIHGKIDFDTIEFAPRMICGECRRKSLSIKTIQAHRLIYMYKRLRFN